MNKNTFFFLLAKIILFLPHISFAQEKPFEFEFHYGLVNTLNNSELNGYSNGFSTYTTTHESALWTHYYGISGQYNFYKSFGLKMGIGHFENGRTISVDLMDTTIGSYTFTKLPVTYQYRTFSLAPCYSVQLKNKFYLDFETGLMFNKTINYLDIRVYSLEQYNFQFFVKFGLSKNINRNFKISLRSSMFQGLNNFSYEGVEKGFIPLSIGGEIGVSYLIFQKVHLKE